MRDAKNLQTINLHIEDNLCRIDSIWINEDGAIFIKVEKDEMMVNYQADKIISLLKEQNLLRANAKIPRLYAENF